MYTVKVDYLRFGFTVETIEEAEQLFAQACEQYPNSYVVVYKDGWAVKEKF